MCFLKKRGIIRWCMYAVIGQFTHYERRCDMIQQDLFDSSYDVDLLAKRKPLAHLADSLLEVYGYGCYLCEEKIDRADCEVDHVLPRAHGGKDDWDNLRPAHWYCNQAKADMMPDNPHLKSVIAAIPDKIKNAIRQNECLDCGINITDRHWRSIYCKPCAEERAEEGTLKWQRENKEIFRIRQNEYGRRRYANDPVFRAKKKEQSRAQKERYATDQEYRDKVKADSLARYHRNKARK